MVAQRDLGELHGCRALEGLSVRVWLYSVKFKPNLNLNYIYMRVQGMMQP